MSSDSTISIKRRNLSSLVEIATAKCIQNVAKLQDIGTTPFHLLKPILKRMTAKQLDHVERQSPQITPESDQLWPYLIEKEFPDRPLFNKKIHINNKEFMPNKSLFYRYYKEREMFRNDSAERLRNITKKLKMEKSANSIVAVPQLLKDPTVRRKNYSNVGYSRQTSAANKGSILNRARRELQSRSLMFPGYQNKTKAYDPYEAFQSIGNHRTTVTDERRQSNQTLRVPTSRIKSPIAIPKKSLPVIKKPLIQSYKQDSNSLKNIVPGNLNNNNKINKASTSLSTIINIPQAVKQRFSPETQTSVTTTSQAPSLSTLKQEAIATSKSIADTPRTPPHSVPKRKSEPSIFLVRKRRTKTVKPAPIKKPSDLHENKEEIPRKVRSIRSSIFN